MSDHYSVVYIEEVGVLVRYKIVLAPIFMVLDTYVSRTVATRYIGSYPNPITYLSSGVGLYA